VIIVGVAFFDAPPTWRVILGTTIAIAAIVVYTGVSLAERQRVAAVVGGGGRVEGDTNGGSGGGGGRGSKYGGDWQSHKSPLLNPSPLGSEHQGDKQAA
jgi:hypothetical protein